MKVPGCELMPLIGDALGRGQRIRMVATGGSMSPFIRDGDTVEVERFHAPPPLGAVALLELRDRLYVLHRIVGKAGGCWLVRGDNCPAADGVVPEKSFIGLVVAVERKGRRVRIALGAGRLLAWLSARDLLLPIMRTVYFLHRLLKRIKKRGSLS
jgi:hypothetical protein